MVLSGYLMNPEDRGVGVLREQRSNQFPGERNLLPGFSFPSAGIEFGRGWSWVD